MSEIKMPNDKAPSNSHKYNSEVPAKHESMPNPKIIVKKPSNFKKFARNFFSEDVKDLGDYVLNGIISRAIKDTFFDIVTNGLRMALFGDTRPAGRTRQGLGSKYSYDSIVDTSRTNPYYGSRRSWNFEDIVIRNHEDAIDYLGQMYDILQKYNRVRVADFYSILAIDDYDYTDNDYGWTDLNKANAYVKAVGGGWVIVLPKPVPLSRNRIG